MGDIIETVRIKDAGFPGGLIINKFDFNPNVHVLFNAAESAQEKSTDVDTDPEKKQTRKTKGE